jgi:hypothetical protein
MKYSLGVNLADFGFGFLEGLHEPIFLIHRLGKIVRMNGAGRKLLWIAKRNSFEVEEFINTRLLQLFRGTKTQKNYERIAVGNKGYQIVARNLQGSDFILVEVVR